MARAKAKRVSRSVLGTVPIAVFLILLGILMMVPFVYAILQSIKPLEEFYIFPPRFWVSQPTLKNFTQLFKLSSGLWVPFSRYLFNTVYLAIVCTALQVITGAMAAYPLSKYQFKGQGFIFNVIVLSLMFSADVLFLPQYIMISSFGMIDTHWSMILPSIAYTMGLYLMRQNMVAFPTAIIEAARIDGAPERKVFWSVLMPNMKPAWMTMVVFSFGSMWGRADTTYIYSEQLKGLPTLFGQIASSGIARAGVGAAATVLLMVPPILVFFVTQSSVIETMVNSGIKE